MKILNLQNDCIKEQRNIACIHIHIYLDTYSKVLAITDLNIVNFAGQPAGQGPVKN